VQVLENTVQRIQFFELADLAWFPQSLRDAGTAYITRVSEIAGDASRFSRLIADALVASRTDRIVDLCSGAGGPALAIARALSNEGKKVSVILSDLRPNHGALERTAQASDGLLTVSQEPIDAAHVPPSARGLRMMFNAFHHFAPMDVKRVLSDAVQAGQPIGIFEFVENSWPAILGMLFSPLLALFLVPSLRPFRLSWILFTYILPIIPFTIAFDGLISCLRVYSPTELRVLVDALGETGYTWSTARLRTSGPVSGTYLIGVPPSNQQ